MNQPTCQSTLTEGQAYFVFSAVPPLSYLCYAGSPARLGVADGRVFCEDAVPLQTLLPGAWSIRQPSAYSRCCRIDAEVNTGAVIRPQVRVRVGEVCKLRDSTVQDVRIWASRQEPVSLAAVIDGSARRSSVLHMRWRILSESGHQRSSGVS